MKILQAIHFDQHNLVLECFVSKQNHYWKRENWRGGGPGYIMYRLNSKLMKWDEIGQTVDAGQANDCVFAWARRDGWRILEGREENLL